MENAVAYAGGRGLGGSDPSCSMSATTMHPHAHGHTCRCHPAHRRMRNVAEHQLGPKETEHQRVYVPLLRRDVERAYPHNFVQGGDQHHRQGHAAHGLMVLHCERCQRTVAVDGFLGSIPPHGT